MKDDGNLKIKEKKLKEAEGLYRDGLMHLSSVKNDNAELNKLKVVLHQNLSIVLNQTGNYKDTIENCTLALAVDGQAFKALYHRHVAHLKLKNYDQATEDLKAAIKLQPANKQFRADFETLKVEKKKAAMGEQEVMKKFFEQGVYNEKENASNAREYDALPSFL